MPYFPNPIGQKGFLRGLIHRAAGIHALLWWKAKGCRWKLTHGLEILGLPSTFHFPPSTNPHLPLSTGRKACPLIRPLGLPRFQFATEIGYYGFYGGLVEDCCLPTKIPSSLQPLTINTNIAYYFAHPRTRVSFVI